MNSASDRAREASSACEIILASDPDIALSVCCFQILLPPESILFIKTRLIIDQFKRPSISRRQNVAIIVLLKALAQIASAACIELVVHFRLQDVNVIHSISQAKDMCRHRGA